MKCRNSKSCKGIPIRRNEPSYKLRMRRSLGRFCLKLLTYFADSNCCRSASTSSLGTIDL